MPSKTRWNAQPPQAQASAQTDVVERMAKAIAKAHTDYHPTESDYRDMATAALAEARRGCYTAAQVEKAVIEAITPNDHPDYAKATAQAVLAALGAPEPMERVTVLPLTTCFRGQNWAVALDRQIQNPRFDTEQEANRYAAGLRAKLAALAAKEPRA